MSFGRSAFTPEELEELRLFDEIIDAENLSYEDYKASKLVDELTVKPKMSKRKSGYMKKYREKNKEKIKDSERNYRLKNKKMLAEKNKRYRKDNREMLNAYNRHYYEKNKERISAHRSARYYMKKHNEM